MELTIEDIRTLQLAVDNMADDGMTDEGIKKLLVLHAKLEVMATRLTKRAPDSLKAVVSRLPKSPKTGKPLLVKGG